ncbi:hypothetical protein NKG05_26120 [Oerskovia sp. M15]
MTATKKLLRTSEVSELLNTPRPRCATGDTWGVAEVVHPRPAPRGLCRG